jgi:cytochrome P450
MSTRSRAFFRNFLVATDQPAHTRLRGLVNRAFTPRQVNRLDERMAKLIDELIADFDPHGTGEIELMNDFAVPFPARVIADLFGMDAADWRWLRDASATGVKLLDPFRGFDPAEMDMMVDELYDRVLSLAAERRADPRDDLITGLALAEADDGDRLSEDELVSIAGLILFAGHETTAGMFGNSIKALHDHPEQLAMVKAQPELWPNAVEELLRFDTAVISDPRAALVDFEVAGHKIKKGQNVLILNGLANRDLRRFADADELKLDRENPNPISFGHGIHFCLGASLARAELQAGLSKLVEALGDYTIDHDRIEWKPSLTLRAPMKLPITLG